MGHGVVELYANAVVNGLLIGAIYALVATGLNIIFGVMRVVNFARRNGRGQHVYRICLLGVPRSATLDVGAGRDDRDVRRRLCVQRAIGNDFVDQPQHVQFVLYIGLALAITGLHAIIFGPDPRGIRARRVSRPIGSARCASTRRGCTPPPPRWSSCSGCGRGCATA